MLCSFRSQGTSWCMQCGLSFPGTHRGCWKWDCSGALYDPTAHHESSVVGVGNLGNWRKTRFEGRSGHVFIQVAPCHKQTWKEGPTILNRVCRPCTLRNFKRTWPDWQSIGSSGSIFNVVLKHPHPAGPLFVFLSFQYTSRALRNCTSPCWLSSREHVLWW